jgi:hypothetical protein
MRKARLSVFLLLLLAVLQPPVGGAAAPVVTIVSAADGGIQPQAVADPAGFVHVVYFIGDPSGGDLYYAKLTKRRGGFERIGAAIRVNSVAGSALATGTVRGAQIALGRNGIVHIAWHGSKPVDGSGSPHPPVWYARSVDKEHFESQRMLSGSISGIDGSTVAADPSGRVAVAWHGMPARPAQGGTSGEQDRTAYFAASTDDGVTFAAPRVASDAPVGACGCCGLKALFDRTGTLNLLYRAATDGTHRDTTWIAVGDAGAKPPVRVHPWEIEACPMSTFALAQAGPQVAAAWETAQQIYSATLDPRTQSVTGLSAVPGNGSRKHPSIAVNADGERLLAWTEGTAWKRGGRFAWRVTSRDGAELESSPDAGPVPVWGLVSVVALPDRSFVIVR